MTDPIDEIDRLHAEAKRHAENGHVDSYHAACADIYDAWPAIRDRLKSAERRAKAFEAIERGFISSGGLLFVMSSDGNIERSIRLPDEEDGTEERELFDLLTAIESALRGEEQSK